MALVEDDAVTKTQDLLKVARRVVAHDVSTDLADLLDNETAATSGTYSGGPAVRTSVADRGMSVLAGSGLR